MRQEVLYLFIVGAGMVWLFIWTAGTFSKTRAPSTFNQPGPCPDLSNAFHVLEHAAMIFATVSSGRPYSPVARQEKFHANANRVLDGK